MEMSYLTLIKFQHNPRFLISEKHGKKKEFILPLLNNAYYHQS